MPLVKRSLAVLALLCIGAPRSTTADTARAELGVSARVLSRCVVSASAVGFGDYDPLVANSSSGGDKTGTGSVQVTCTKNASGVTIGLGLGTHASGSVRRMQGGPDGEFLNYELYQPTTQRPDAACTGNNVWGTSGAGLLTPISTNHWGTRSAKTFPVCGVLPKGQAVSATGTGEFYTDAVVATVSF